MEMLQPTSPLGAVTIGYVVWRRSVFFVYLPLLIIAVCLNIAQLVLQYNVPIDTYLSNLFSDSWSTLQDASGLLHGDRSHAVATRGGCRRR